jgi:hypothetical protein
MVWPKRATCWSPFSPDLISFELFLWGLVKYEVYVVPVPITLNKLKDRTRQRLQKLNGLCCRMFGTQPNIVFFGAGEQMEHTFSLQRTWKEIFDLHFTTVRV